jgi:hypothetical protein
MSVKPDSWQMRCDKKRQFFILEFIGDLKLTDNLFPIDPKNLKKSQFRLISLRPLKKFFYQWLAEET